VACDLLSPLARACLPPFEQLIRQQMVQLQDSIMERLHHHTFSNMFFDGTFEAHVAQILSCFGPRVGLNLELKLSSQPFDYLLYFFPQHFICDLDYPILQLQASLNVCAHISSTLLVSTFCIMFMATNALEPMF